MAIDRPTPTKLEIAKVVDGSAGSPKEVYANPSDITYHLNFESNSVEQTPLTETVKKGIADNRPPIESASTLKFKLIFDSTGLLYDLPTGKEDVGLQVNDFMKFVCQFKLDGEPSKTPILLQVTWGRMNFRGYINEFSVQYTLFKPNGLAIRATVDIGLKQADKLITMRGSFTDTELDTYKTPSPGSLRSMMNKAKQALAVANQVNEVARANGLPHFRTVDPGTAITIAKDKIQDSINKPKLPVIS